MQTDEAAPAARSRIRRRSIDSLGMFAETLKGKIGPRATASRKPADPLEG